MFSFIFKKFEYMDDLEWFNNILKKASKNRYELRRSKSELYYLYDYGSVGNNVMVRSKEEIKYILSSINLYSYAPKGNDKNRLREILNTIFNN